MAKLPVAYHFKRHYHRDAAGEVLATDGKPYFEVRNGERVPRAGARPHVKALELRKAKDSWHISPNFIEQGQAEGWLKFDGKEVAITHTKGALRYKVKAGPGYYCCHCNAPLPDGSGSTHVAGEHAGVKSPDPQNPSGYKRIHYYDCERVKNG